MSVFDLDGKVAIVTGAAQGIGRGLAVGLSRAGARVAAVDLQQDKLRELEAELGAAGSPYLTFALDLLDIAAFAGAVARVKEHWGRLDLLCNIAGVNLHKDSVDVTEREWDFVLDVNLKALFFCCQAAARVMIPQKRGKIINMCSTFGVVGFPQRVAYCASKGAVQLLTKSLALEWAPHGITVNALAPAAVWTEARAALFSDPQFMENLLRRLPLGRLAQVDDVVNAAIYLASPAADFVTGHVLMVDGGWTAV